MFIHIERSNFDEFHPISLRMPPRQAALDIGHNIMTNYSEDAEVVIVSFNGDNLFAKQVSYFLPHLEFIVAVNTEQLRTDDESIVEFAKQLFDSMNRHSHIQGNDMGRPEEIGTLNGGTYRIISTKNLKYRLVRIWFRIWTELRGSERNDQEATHLESDGQ